MLLLFLRLFLGDPSHPIPFGEVWLIANQWGASPAVLVGTIRNGAFKERTAPAIPKGEFEYRLLIGGSDSPIPAPTAAETDRGYDLGRRFQYFYLSAAFQKDWPTALNRIGPAVPRPVKRTLRFLNMDGAPLVSAEIPVSLFGSDQNHCGWAEGIEIGTFTTDAQGRVSFTAPPSPLVIRYRYSEEQKGGPAGTGFSFRIDLITGPERDITLRKWWTLPAYDYEVTVRPAQPGISAYACLLDLPCGAGCGPVTRAGPPRVTDKAGVLRFHAADLREMEKITLVERAGKERNLTPPEMRELMNMHRVTVEWTAK